MLWAIFEKALLDIPNAAEGIVGLENETATLPTKYLNLLRSDTPMCFRYETFIRQLNKPRSSGRLIDTHSINGWLSYAAFLVLLAATTWALGVARSLVGSDGSVN